MFKLKLFFKANSIYVLLFIINTLFLIWPSIYNGYPLVYSDTGTYINSGFIGEVPIDRPIAYGVFVRHVSLAHSLWFVLIIQAWIIIFYIYILAKRFVLHNTYWFTSLFIAILSITTGISNYTSQIMPDIFTATTIIGMALIITSNKIKLQEYFIILITIFSVITHLSNLVLIILFFFVSIIFILLKLVSKNNFNRILLITIVPIGLLISINKFYTGEFKISRASNVFIIARLIETGIVKDYLISNCNNKNYTLCNYKDDLPNEANKFIWNDDSPFHYMMLSAKI